MTSDLLALNASEADDTLPAYESLRLDQPDETQLERVWNRVRNYGISIAGWNFVLPAGLYSEVLVEPAIAPLPNSPEHFLGLTNVRGNLVPVYRLETCLGLAPVAAAPRYALLVDEWSRGAALVIDHKPQALNLTEFTLIDAGDDLPTILQSAVDEVYQSDAGRWYLINHQSLFGHLSTLPASCS